jgi:hypothetical protein
LQFFFLHGKQSSKALGSILDILHSLLKTLFSFLYTKE